MTIRQRVNFYAGTASGVLSSATQTTITGGAGSSWPIPTNNNGTYYIPVVLNPGYFGSNTTPEIIYITAVTGTVATVIRAQEGTSTISGISMPWVAGITAVDFDVSNLTSTAALNLNNGLTVTGTTTFNNIASFNNGLTVSGGESVTSGNLTIGGNATVTGTLTTNGGLTSTSGSFSGNVNVGVSTIQAGGGTATNSLPSTNGTLINSNGGTLGALTVTGTTNLNGATTVSNSLTAISGITITGTSAHVGNSTFNGTVSITGALTVSGNPINSSWYTKSANAGAIGNGSGNASTVISITVSGYSRYMVVANSSYTGGTGNNITTYITDGANTTSAAASTYMTSATRASLGNNIIYTYSSPTLTTMSLVAYANGTGVNINTADISVIGLS